MFEAELGDESLKKKKKNYRDGIKGCLQGEAFREKRA